MTGAFTATDTVPDPIDWDEVDVNVLRVELVSHSNHAFVVEPFGFTSALRVAELDVTPVAGSVLTVGSTALVVKFAMDPFCVPATFWPTTRK